MAELMGQTQTATYTYMTAPRFNGLATPNFLPTIGNASAPFKPYDTYPAPTPLRRSLTTLPWRPGTYYGTARIEPGIAHAYSMPEPLSERTKLAELDSFKARSSAERIRMDTSRLCRELNEKTTRTQMDVGRRLGDRLGDIEYWKSEIHHETDNMISEIESLSRAKAVLEKTLMETEAPLRIAQECLYSREKRKGIDLVHDEVERALIKEVDNIKRCQEEMKRLVQKANNQLALNRAAQHELEKDSGDKLSALNLDSSCHQMRNSSRGIQYYDGIHRVDNTVSVPQSWAKFSDSNIRRSQSERQASRDVRNAIEQLCNSVTTSLMNEWNTVSSAFSDRIKEYTDARNQLQTHLSKVLQEIFDMEKNIELLKTSIREKEAPMQVAQTRLAVRTQRPSVEACRDPVQHRLVEEVYEINESVDQLKTKLREAENSLQHLLRNKMALEHDLGVKNNSLFIDRETCLGMRKTFPMLPRVAIY